MKRKLGLTAAIGIAFGMACFPLIGLAQSAGKADAGNGPVFTVQMLNDLFNSLDLSRPELKAATNAWTHRETALAVKELARYYRTRASVHWSPESEAPATPSQASQSAANDALEGKMQAGPVPPAYTFPGGNVDWHFNVTYHIPGKAPNNEWQWQMNRQYLWSDLGVAYRASRDERYSAIFVKELRSWIQQCPEPNQVENGVGSSWRTLEAGVRVSSTWMDAFYAFRDSPEMTDSDILAMVHSMLEHGRYLRNFHTRLNWLTTEMSGLYTVGAEFPEFKQSAEWRHYAAAALAEQAQGQFLPDGAQMELSSNYQNVALGSMLHIAEVAEWTGNGPELSSGYVAQFEKGYDWLIGIMAPDRFLPRINDSGPNRLTTILTKAATFYPEKPELKWLASDGKEGSPPKYTSIFLNRSGFAAMRSGWEHDANFLLFRLGPLGMGHQHQDTLGVNVWAYGRELLFNGGGGPYETSKWREWALSGYSHNVVVIDGLAQNRPITQGDPSKDPNLVSTGPINGHWKTNSGFDFASGVYNQGYGPSQKTFGSHQRDVLFLKPDIFVIADRFSPSDSQIHSFQARWQLQTTHSQIDPSTQTLVTSDSGVANIAIAPLLLSNMQVKSASGQEQPEILGWNFRSYPKPELSPATTLLHTLKGSGPHLILTLLVPLRPGETNPIAKVEPGQDGVSATAIFKDGRQLLIAARGPIGIAVKETLANGKPGRSVAESKW
jgi:hypothetical protein